MIVSYSFFRSDLSSFSFSFLAFDAVRSFSLKYLALSDKSSFNVPLIIFDLLKQYRECVKQAETTQNANNSDIDKLKIAMVGAFSSGKSSFLNALLNKNLTEVGITQTTRCLTNITYGEISQIKDINTNKTYSESEYKSLSKTGSDNNIVQRYLIAIPDNRLEGMVLIDSPGFEPPIDGDKDKNLEDVAISEKAAMDADVVFFLLDIGDGTLKEKNLEYLKKLNTRTEENSDNVSFSWKQESEAESYTIKIADNPLLNNPKITETTSSNFILLDLKKNKLKDGKYYWAVFMTDFEGNVSEMSEPRSFFAMKGKPEQHLIEPAEGFRAYHALVPDTRFTWKRKLPENFISRLQIAIDEKFSHFVYDSEITGNSFKGANLELGTYYWRLVSKSDSLETELITPARTLVVTGNLEAADLINPSDCAVARENVPYVFEWNEVEDADYYKFSIFRQSDGTLIYDDTVYDLQTRLDMFNNPKFEDKAMYKWQIQAFSNGVPGVASRRIGNISEKDFYLVKLRPVEIDFPPKNMQVNGIDAVLSPISARWSSVDSIEKAQFVLTKTDETPPREILRIPSDIQMQSGNKIAPSQILLDTKDGLRAGKYEIIVYAQNADGIDISNTERKNRGYFSVLPVPPLKTAENLKAEPSVFNAEYLRNLNNPKEIRLSWEKVPDATEYLLSIKKKNEKKALVQTVVNDKASYTLDFKILSDKDKSAFSKGNFAWSVKPVRRIDSDKDGIPDKLLQEGKEAKSSFMTDIPIPKKSKAKGASNPYGN